ncbi:MAG: YCF48-related protein [Phycisphaerales bacterium]|nr:YCF48-related protein [Phycisphaerales bacterium]
MNSKKFVYLCISILTIISACKKTIETNKSLYPSYPVQGSYIVVGPDGLIYKTYDNGTTWIAKNSNTTQSLIGVVSVTPSLIIAVGYGGTILQSLDTGNTWVPVNSGTNQNLLAVSFFDNNNGVAVGANSTIVITNDGGNTWNASDLGIPYSLFAVAFTSDTTIVAGGQIGIAVRTSNTGKTWYQVNNPKNNKNINSITFLNADTGIMVGESKIVLQTVDGGFTWTYVNFATGNIISYNSVVYRSEDSAILVGGLGFVFGKNPGNPFLTLIGDEGQITSQDLFSIAFYSTQIGMAIGSAGNIIRTATGGNTADDWEEKANNFNDYIMNAITAVKRK